MSDSTELAVVQEIPQLAQLEDVEPEAMERLNNLIKIMSSSTVGIEGAAEWRPEKLKLNHPITKDDMCPDNVAPGDLYVPGRRVWSREEDGRSNPFKFVLCYAYRTRARFPEGEGQPDCTSADLEWNDHGTLKCEDCPDLPFGPKSGGKPTNCNTSWNMVILPLDLSGVYTVRFSKTSYKAGSNVVKLLKTALRPWDKAFGLTSKLQSGSNYDYNVFQTMPLGDEEPAPEVKLFAEHVCESYEKVREEYLESLREARENASEGLDAMAEGLGATDDDFEDDEGFEDTM